MTTSTASRLALTILIWAAHVDSFSAPCRTSIAGRSRQETEDLARSKHNNLAFNALFTGVPETPKPVPYKVVHGRIPEDFPPGSLLRLGPNGASSSEGFFDGDGMIQSVTFPPQVSSKASDGTFSATYVDTLARKLEAAAETKFEGTLGGVPHGYPLLGSVFKNAIAFKTLQAQKDTCNTALAQHGGRVLAMMEQCPPSEIQVNRDGSIQTLKSSTNLDGAIKVMPVTGGSLSAHGRTCPDTGERIHVSYDMLLKPYVRVDVFSEGFKLRKSIAVDVPIPIMLHDCAITPNYVVIMDLPLTVRIARFAVDKFPVEYEPSHAARIGLVPRHGDGETLWFDCEPGVVLHAVNAFETENGKVILHGTRCEPRGETSFLNSYASSYLHEYSMDLSSGKLEESCLNSDHIVEFPVIEPQFNGKKISHCYCSSVLSIGGPLSVCRLPQEGITLDGVIKFALANDGSSMKGDVLDRFVLPVQWYAVTEPTVVAKQGTENGEYVILIATHIPSDTLLSDVENGTSGVKSQVQILDGDNLSAGPVFSAELPYWVPYGLHSSFVNWKQMK